MDAEEDARREWDARYAGGHDAPLWSGHPNGALVAEAADLPPGRALDVGCGEGADAIWLARRGWQVTAIDPSGVALERARRAAAAADVEVAWLRATLLSMPGGAAPYDLVSAQYPVLPTAGGAVVAALTAAVAPGGTLLVVHHDPDAAHARRDGCEHVHGEGRGFDPAGHVMPSDVRASLDDRWTIEVDTTRSRSGPLGADARHVADVVLRARRSG